MEADCVFARNASNMVHVKVTLLCAALIGVLGAAFMMKGGDSQRFHCKEAGWTRFQNSCGIVLVSSRVSLAVAHPLANRSPL